MTTTFAIERSELKRCDLFQVSGRIDGATAPAFESSLKKSLDTGQYRLVLDLSEVNYMSSAAIRVLITTQKQCKRYNRGKVLIAAPSERVKQVLDIAGLEVLFDVYDTGAEAVGSF